MIIDATYLNQVNRIYGPDSLQGRWHGDGWFGNVSRQLPITKLTAFAYVLDFEPLVTSFRACSRTRRPPSILCACPLRPTVFA